MGCDFFRFYIALCVSDVSWSIVTTDRNEIVLLISSFFSVLLAWVPIRVQFGVVRGVLERLGVVRNGLGVLWGV